MKLHFVRHGNAQHNVYLKLNESNNRISRLTAQGKREVLKTAKDLQRMGVRFDIIYCSPLVRCRQTAEIINEAFNNQIPIKIEPRLSEFKTGFDNKSVFIWTMKLFLSKNRLTKKFGNGQSIAEVIEDIKEFYDELKTKTNHDNVLLVSHLFQFQLLCHIYYGYKLKMPWSQNIHLGTGEIYKFKNKKYYLGR